MSGNTVIDYLRHGEPVGGNRYRGNGVDDPLSEKGWRQMWEGVGEFSEWDAIVTSPMLRCREFAESLGEKREIPVQVDERLREVGFGEWEGKTREELLAERAEEFEAFYTDPVNNTPSGAETVSDFYSRVSEAHADIKTTHQHRHVLLVGHAGVIRACLVHAMGATPDTMYNLEIRNGRISRVQFESLRTRLQLINGTIA